MADISEVAGITGSTLELFKAAGIATPESLLARGVSEILADLDAVNSRYEVAVRRPSETTIRAWQDSARILLKKQQRATAKMVPEENLRAAGINVSAVPVAKVVADLPPRPRSEPKLPELGPKLGGAAESVPPAAKLPALPAEREAASPAKGQRPPEPVAKPQEIRGGSPKPAAQSEAPAKGVPAGRRAVANRKEKGARPAKSLPPKKKSASGADAPIRRPGPEAPPEQVYEDEEDRSNNRFRHVEVVRGAKPQGERRNRGMSHPNAPRVWLAAAITILAPAACVVAGAVLLGALVMARVHGWEFHWTIALVLLVFPFSLILYLSIGAKARCRLCGQRLFVPKHCLKHERARRSLFGYTYGVARDAMLFGSYRCMLCGTKTRLKG